MTDKSKVFERKPLVLVGLIIIGAIATGVLLSGLLGSDSDKFFYVIIGIIGLLAGGALLVQPRWGTYLVVLSFPFIALIPRGAYIPGFKLDEVLIITSLLAVLVKKGATKYRISLRLTRIDYVYWMLFIAGSVLPSIGVLMRGQIPDWLEIIALLKQYAIYRLVLATLKSQKHLSKMVTLLLFPSLLVSLIALLQMLDVANVRFLLAEVYGGSAHAVYRGYPYRATSVLGNWNALGGYATLNLLLSLSLIEVRRSLGFSFLVSISFVASLIALMLSGSSSSIVGFLVGSFVWLTIKKKFRLRHLLYLALILVFSLVIFQGIGKDVLQAQIERQVGDRIVDRATGKVYKTYGLPRSVVSRWALAKYIFELMVEDVLALFLGFGAGAESVALLPWGTAESGYLAMFFFYGPMFLVMYFVLLRIIQLQSRRIRCKFEAKDGLRYRIAVVAEMIVSAMSIINIIHPYYSAAGITHYFWIFVGCSVSLSYFPTSHNGNSQ
jgi:hypothetical protein